MPTYTANGIPPDPIPHDVDEVLDYVVDWSAVLTADSDTIASDSDASKWTVPSTGVNLGDGTTALATRTGAVTAPAPTVFASNQKTRVYVQITALGQKRIENTIRTTGGRVHSRTFVIDARDR